MVRVLILGSTGLLGNAVGEWFLSHTDKYETYLTYRNESVSYGKNKVFFDCLSGEFADLPKVDYIINCIGTIKPFVEENPLETIEINSTFPWRLAAHCERTDTRLIHITTDCVFSGAKGQYTESDDHDALDKYGKSKSLGEPTNCMVLRTSIIGEELHKKASLVEWAKSQAWAEVSGYVNHHWNGISTRQYASVCDQIITSELYSNGLFHIFSPQQVTKYELLSFINDRFKLLLKVVPIEADRDIDRVLSTEKELNSKLFIPHIQQQIEEM